MTETQTLTTSLKEKPMKLFSILALAALSFPAFSQTCQVQMVDNYSRVIRVFTAYGDQTCIEGMKECRKTIRLQPQLGGVDCIRVGSTPAPQPQPHPQPHPQPQPQPYPQPQPNPYPPQYGQIPEEVLRMNEIEQAINYVLEDCHVLPRVSGWANQLYIRGQFAGNYEIGRQDQELRRAIRDYQARGQCLMKHSSVLSIQFDRLLIESAIDRSLSRNCHVMPRVSGWANQLFIDNQFSGNFDINKPEDQMKLKAALADHLSTGRCIGRSRQEIQLLRDPRLIQDFANFQYRGCHVKLNVSGWANQLYVGNQFKGNFDSRSEVQKLQASLVELVLNRTCIYDPM
jgi:hypothetical protein